MNPKALRLAAILSGALVVPMVALAGPADTLHIGGHYRSSTNPKSISIRKLGPGMYCAEADGWSGVGLFDGSHYWGGFQMGREGEAHSSGTFEGSVRRNGSILLHGEVVRGPALSFDVEWTPEVMGNPPPGEPRPDSDALPTPDDYVYVEELPEAITKVPPSYPDVGRDVQGTVLVQALVGTDGRVKDTKVLKSVPMLDEAAMAAVRQWVFKPAMAKGRPVAVWVAVPVKFTRH